MNFQIMPMVEHHLDQIVAIERQAHSHPWAESLLRDLNSRGACHRVLVVEEHVVGYFYAQHIVGEVTLLNIAVAPQHQGLGYGKAMLDGFVAECEALQAESAWLEVRESNTGAIHLYEEWGFNEVDRRRNYYPTQTGHEDAIIMSLMFF